jgi:hypothetical protein
MAITAEQVATVLTELGMDEASFRSIMTGNGLVMALRKLDAAIDNKRREQQTANQQFETELQALQAQRADLQAQVDAALGR